jgi:hypothetical protein
MRDEEDRPRDVDADAAGVSWDASALDSVVVPDDLRDLADDIEAYRRELRSTRRRDARRHALSRRGVGSTLVVTGALVLAAVVATLLTVLGPSVRQPAQTALPLATTTVAEGEVHGLLPGAVLRDTNGLTRNAQSLRPAVFALIPMHCSDCVPLLDSLAGQANAEGYQLDVVAPAAQDADAAALPGRLHNGPFSVWYDASARLASLRATDQGVTVVLVDRDATIVAIDDDVAPSDTALSAQLQRMRSATSVSGVAG